MSFAYGYGRVSTARQEISVDAQHTTCKQFWEYRLKPMGVEWGGWYADAAVSGRTEIRKRPSAKVLFERLESGDHVIFSKMDRAFRSAIDQALTIETILQRGIAPHFLDAGVDATTPTGKMALGILAAVAEFERSRISERMKDAAAERRRQGLAWSPSSPRIGVRFKTDAEGNRRALWHKYELLCLREAYLLVESGWNAYQIWRKFWVERKRKDTNKKERDGDSWSYNAIKKGIMRYRQWLAEGTLPEYARPDALNSPTPTESSPTTATQSLSPKEGMPHSST